MNKFNDDFIADAIIQSEYLEYKYKDVIETIHNSKINITTPISDLDPYYTIETVDAKNKIKLKASYIGKKKNVDEIFSYLNWSWSNPELPKASKINLLKLFKYFLDQEPPTNNNSSIFMRVYGAFIQSFIQIEERFFYVLMNALLHLMKHIFFIMIPIDNDIVEIYFIKEIIE